MFSRLLAKISDYDVTMTTLEQKAKPTMSRSRYMQILFTVAFVMLGNTAAVADEKSESAAETSPGAVVKVKKAIEHGAKAVAHGIERGANATVRGVKRGATATSNAAHSVVRKVGGSSNESSSSDK